MKLSDSHTTHIRIAELSATSAVATATITYYQREGLLPPGEATGPNQASYGEEHIRRLRLIRSLIDVGGLSVAFARGVLGAVDTPDLRLAQVFGFDAIGHPELADFQEGYAEAVVAGTVLGDAMFAALRRIAQEHVTFELHPVAPSEAPGHTAIAPGAAVAGRDDPRGLTPPPT